MSFRQTVLKTFYPALIWLSKLTGRRSDHLRNPKGISPAEAIYQFTVPLNNGQLLPLQQLKGKKLLIVNTASDCGYTNQYGELQELQTRMSDRLVVIGFPANDFKEQEKGSDEEISSFCRINYGVSFPLAKKSTVVNGESQNKIFHWLSHAEQNGWCNRQPTWNFSKYVLNEEGMLTHYFDPAVSPLSKDVLEAVE
jgi:glutathione peroxidase